MKFYICENCKKIVYQVVEQGCPLMCCGQALSELEAGVTDAAAEKHVPVYEVNGDTVDAAVGSVAHPMLEKHYINFIALETNQGVQIKNLKPDEEPKAQFKLAEGEEVAAVYEYCNLHGLWKA